MQIRTVCVYSVYVSCLCSEGPGQGIWMDIRVIIIRIAYTLYSACLKRAAKMFSTKTIQYMFKCIIYVYEVVTYYNFNMCVHANVAFVENNC